VNEKGSKLSLLIKYCNVNEITKIFKYLKSVNRALIQTCIINNHLDQEAGTWSVAIADIMAGNEFWLDKVEMRSSSGDVSVV